MSRSAAKSRADKGGRRPSAHAAIPQPQDADVDEIILGRLTLAQWMDMLRQEEAEEIVAEIMEELLSRVMDGCFQAYIERQLGPFCTSWAQACLVQVLEWQFLYRDEGEGPEEASRTEDSEPLPAPADSWAQGCVPVISITPPPHPTPQQGAASQVAGLTKPRADQRCHVMSQTSISPKQSEENKGPSEPSDHKSIRVLTPIPPPKSNQKKRRQIHSHRSIATDKLLWSQSTSAERKDTEKEGEKTVLSICTDRLDSLHQHKHYHHIPKLSHSSLPQHCVSPQYEILDTKDAKPHPKRPSALSTPEWRLNKQQTALMGKSLKPLSSSMDQPTKPQGTTRADVRLSLRKKSSPTRHKRDGIVPFSGTLRLDKMDLAQGVSLMDPQIVQLNQLKVSPPAQSTELRPMRSGPAVPLFSVKQLTTGPPPQVTPPFQS